MSTKSDPATGAVAVTPSDSTTFARARSLYVGVSGDVVIKTPHNSANVTFTAVPVGILPVESVQVLATGTTATDIVALY